MMYVTITDNYGMGLEECITMEEAENKYCWTAEEFCQLMKGVHPYYSGTIVSTPYFEKYMSDLHARMEEYIRWET